MPMTNALVLIDEMYPFGKDEPFLETEVNYYEQFDKVLIFPCSAADYSDIRSIASSKIDILTKNGRYPALGRLLKFRGYVSALFNPLTISEIKSLAGLNKLNLSTLKALLAFVSKAAGNFGAIGKRLENYGFKREDNIIFYSYWMHFHSYIAIRLKKNYPNSKAVSRCHRFDLYEYLNEDDYIPLRPWILKNLDAVFSISADGKKYLDGRYRDIKRNVRVSRLGTPDRGVRSTGAAKRPLKIVSCSWVLPVKRLERIAETLAALGDYPMHWTHIGDGGLFEKIRKYAEENIAGKIACEFKGALSNGEVLDLYCKEDFHVFINVSESEGIPVSVMEAMSFGIPAIATDVGGVNEIVIDGYNGFLIRRDFTNDELGRRILEIYNMKDEEYRRLRKNSREYWEQNYDQDKNYRMFFEEMASFNKGEPS